MADRSRRGPIPAAARCSPSPCRARPRRWRPMIERPEVIVVDDDDAVRDSLAFLFRSAGYQVQAYGSAQDALSALPPGTRGCVVTDVRMPGMSGIDLLRELKASVQGVSVIVITGHGDV